VSSTSSGASRPCIAGAQLVERLVDDRVRPDLDALALGGLAGLADRPHVEADDDRLRRGGEHDVGLVDAADRVVQHVDLDLVLRELGDLVLERLGRAGDVGLEHEVELGELLLAGAAEDVLERVLAAGPARERLGLQAGGALGGLRPRGAVVLEHAERLAGVGDGVEAEDLDGLAGDGLLDARERVVLQRADLAPGRAGDERVADLQRAALDEHGDDRAAARVELGLDDDAGGVRGRVGPQLLDLGHDVDRLEQVVEAGLRPWRTRRRTRSRRPTRPAGGPAPSSPCGHGSGRRPPCRPC
jgi:hypothetical protein